MVETEELLIFTRIVAARSLARASQELRIPRATVSRRLAGLEEKLAVRLVARTTRSLSLTPAGRAFLVHAQAVVDAARAAEASIARANDDAHGDVRLSTSAPFAHALSDVVADFLVAHPRVRVLADVSMRPVDLRREPFDLAVRASGKLPPGLVARRLARTYLGAYAAPSYVARRGVPVSARDLREHAWLLGLDEGMKPRAHVPTRAWGSVRVAGAFHASDPLVLLAMCVRGLGLAVLPNRVAADDVARGRLVAVLPEAIRVDGAVSVVYADRRLMARHVRLFVDWVVARAPAVLDEPRSKRG